MGWTGVVGERLDGSNEVVPLELDVEGGCVDDGHLAGSVVFDVDQSRAADQEPQGLCRVAT